MPITTYPLPANINSINLFPDYIENDHTIFYHGTNELFSNQIESFGFSPSFRPLTNYFFEIYEIAEKLSVFTAGNEEFQNFNFAQRDAYEYLKAFTRISFSAVSICAADYSIGITSGGQGLRHLTNLKREISSLNYAALPNMVCDISDRQKWYLKNIDNQLIQLKQSNGVVYAVQFDSNDLVNLSYDNHPRHGVLFNCNHVPPVKIVGKMIIPQNLNLPQTAVNEGDQHTKDLLLPQHCTQFLRNIIDKNRARNDIRDCL
jgi:hypothetical protein